MARDRTHGAPRYPLVLRGGRIAGDPTAPPRSLDVAVGPDGRIHEMAPRLPARGVDEWDLRGRLVMPGLVDVHQHLDKCLTARAVPNPSGTLAGAIMGFQEYAGRAGREEILHRAARVAEACLARGTVAIRTHANVDDVWGLRAVEALVELRARLRARLRLQVVALVGGAPLATETARGLLEEALEAGADVVGGVPALASEPERYLDMLFAVAVRRDRPLDLHVDETLDPACRYLAGVARRTREHRLAGRVVAGHCCSLAALPPEEAAPIIEAVADAGVGVVTLPASNLFLQGRGAGILAPRGLTRVADLLRAGVPVAYASDNIQDPFTPVGSGDLLEIGRWTLLAAQLPADGLGQVVAMGTTVPAAMMGMATDYGLRPGAHADLLVLDAADAADALCTGPAVRTVFVGGRHVAGPRPI
ncbi:MAG: amidohydrolase family protein [Armatimonadota bacterium]|nr:amidohydrolase family protein [Armatimonadota bacterium]MDR7532870.1 amidohydrolase family protein [Armatimonadota bacterium]MDR7535126.1 amidohydrolase family protein [Armatimonadota bacterium]